MFWKPLSRNGGFSPRQWNLSEGGRGTQINLLLRNPPQLHVDSQMANPKDWHRS